MAPIIIVSGPSGCGKTTLLHRLLADEHWPLRLSVSVTTRKARINEQPGVAYHFWSASEFERTRDAGAFLEWAQVHGNYYGTLENEVTPYIAIGMGVFLDIDVQGWEQVKKKCPQAVSIFVRTSKFEVLEQRLQKRHTDSQEAIQTRIKNAQKELARADEYDHQVINDDLVIALALMRKIVGSLFV